MLFYSSAVFNYYNGDSGRYLRLGYTGLHGLFADQAIPAGYPALLQALRAISSNIAFVIGAQHVMGFVTGVLLYLAMRRAEAPRGVALIPAAVVLLSGDQVFLEHAVLTESPWTMLIAAGLYAAVRAYRPVSYRWLASAGALLALAALVRHAALLLPFLIAAWTSIAVSGRARLRLCAALAVALPALALLGAYVGVAKISGGYVGFTDRGGSQLYGRVAQFADCHKFAAPPVARRLCDAVQPSRRHADPVHYLYDPDAPLQAIYHRRLSQSILRRFAISAIEAQPFTYMRTVLHDYARYVDPGFGSTRRGAGARPADMSFASRRPFASSRQANTLPKIAASYRERFGDVRSKPIDSAADVLGDYQSVMRVHGLLVPALVIITLLGLVLVRGLPRAVVALFFICALFLYAVPPAIAQYDVRYGVPAAELLAAAAALAGWGVIRRLGPSA
jgi:hypothetical protein